MRDSPILRIIQISDTHLYADREKELLGVNTHQSFQSIINLLQNEKDKIDVIIHSGDLSQDSSEHSYVKIADMLNPFNVPTYCVPGNHDDPTIMAKIYPRKTISNQRHILHNNWQIILLDSHKPGAVEGYLDHTQLSYLQNCLQAHPEHHAIVIFHHQPLPVGSRWLDNVSLMNADEFWRIISNYPKMKNIFFGHVHQQFEQKMNGVQCYSVPSTCTQFKRNQEHFSLEKLPPGYRWVHLYEDGSIETNVVRAAEYVGYFDDGAKGY